MSDKKLFGLLSLFVVVLGVLWYAGPDIYRHMGGRYEEARREIYEESQAHVHGTIEHLNRLKLEYETAEPGHRAALRTTILTSLGDVDENKLPIHLQNFINKLRR